MVPFGEWLPDLPPLGNAAMDIYGCIATHGGYRPFPSFTPQATAVDARAQGAIAVRDPTTGLIFNFSGTATKLYKMASDGGSWTDASRAVGGAYATPSNGNWWFAPFGSTVIATNGADDAQEYIFGGTGKFTKLGGTPSTSTFVKTVDPGFVVLGRYGGQQELPDGGQIMGMAGGAFPLIFQERAIRRMAFAGPPIVFSFDKVSDGMGCMCSGSIASYHDVAFFLSPNGFYMVQGASQIAPIGAGKVNKWLLSRIDTTRLHLASSCIDTVNSIYFFLFPSGSSVVNAADTLMAFHWPTGAWTYINTTQELVYQAIKQSSYNVDTVDGYLGGPTPGAYNLDTLPYPLDNTIYAGLNDTIMSGFDTTHASGFFNGVNTGAVIETGDFQITPGRKTMWRGARPIVSQGASGNTVQVYPTMTPLYRDFQQSALTTGDESPVNAYGFCPMRVNARYFRARVAIPAGSQWDFATGIDDMKSSVMGAR
jgi:hypothetical protein